MGIFRVKKDNNYSVINNTGLKDKRLSWKAKGILAYILTLPDDWVFYREELSQHAKDGINSLRAGMQELKEYGYIKRFPVRDEKNKIVRWETIIYEIPLDDYPSVENPPAGKPVADNLPVENHKLLNTNIQSTKELSTDIQNINHRHDKKQKLISQRLINDDFKISHQFFMKNRISLSEVAIIELSAFCESLGNELIVEAVNRSIDENVPKWRYIRRILKNWEAKKVKTLKDVAMLDAQFDLGKNKKQFGLGNTNRNEMVPEWLYEKEEVPEEQPIKNNELTIEEERERLKTLLKKYKS
ncbi:DNA-binding protein [Bacillus cereus]|nr:DNA-binding protein [Bacillus cereus]